MRKVLAALAAATALPLLVVRAEAQPDVPTSGGVTVSASTVRPGETPLVSGGGASPGATATIALSGASGARTLGRATAAADGTYRTAVRIPGDLAAGPYTLTASSGGDVLAATTIRILATATGGPGGLPFSGADVLPGLAAGAALIVAGGLLLLSINRRPDA